MFKMSVLFTSSVGWLLSHEKYLNEIYETVLDNKNKVTFKVNPNLFKIENPFTRRSKSKESISLGKETEILDEDIENVKSLFDTFVHEVDFSVISPTSPQNVNKNFEALTAAECIYSQSEASKNLTNSFGGNNLSDCIFVNLNNEGFLFPPNCQFFIKDVSEIATSIENNTYDLILLDPPWWNKYIRRKKMKNKTSCYEMMYNEDLMQLPLEKMLSDNGIIVVWCTNSKSHQNMLLNVIFPKWKVNFYSKWYWLKITRTGVPVCSFSKPPGKQPFELIFIATKNAAKQVNPSKLIVSVPSALHSHKPPLNEVLKDLLSNEPKCLEIFSRYLLPGWTSWGLEVLRLQHSSVYVREDF